MNFLPVSLAAIHPIIAPIRDRACIMSIFFEMTIYKLEREATAEYLVKKLPKLWNNINHLVLQLQDTGRTYTTTELYNYRNSFVSIYNLANDFNTIHGTWFDSRYPEFATALDGAITSLSNINGYIITGLQTYYWDAELDAPVIADISQAHRDALASQISGELE